MVKLSKTKAILMNHTSKESVNNAWPLQKFSFSVKIGDTSVLCQEVDGLNSEMQQIEYRQGNSNLFSTHKMPDNSKHGNVTLKKGIFPDKNAMRDLRQQLTFNSAKTGTIIISLLDENESPAMRWILANAFPTKMTVPDINQDSNAAIVESIELSHEGITPVK